MYPTKSTYDYMTEMNRLFPRTTENNVYQTPNAVLNASFCSPFRQATPVNQSSSSADSLSPDCFPDMSHRLDNDRPGFETPFIVRRQRPIIGRKIFENPERLRPMLEPPLKPFEHEIEFPKSVWQSDDHVPFPVTPPSFRVEQKNYTQNICYELFPTEKKGFEFKPPVATLSPVSNYKSLVSNYKSPVSNYNSPVSNYKPPVSNYNSPVSNYRSPVSNYKPVSPSFSPTLPSTSPNRPKVWGPRMPTSPLRLPSQPNFGPSSSRQQEMRPEKMCTFCRKNGETPLVYMTHMVRENVGNQNIVTCPILRSHVCSTCGASGDNAHTITYCPVLRSNNNGRPLQSTTITLKNTRIKSNGRRRF